MSRSCSKKRPRTTHTKITRPRAAFALFENAEAPRFVTQQKRLADLVINDMRTSAKKIIQKSPRWIKCKNKPRSTQAVERDAFYLYMPRQTARM